MEKVSQEHDSDNVMAPDERRGRSSKSYPISDVFAGVVLISLGFAAAFIGVSPNLVRAIFGLILLYSLGRLVYFFYNITQKTRR